MKKVFKLSAMLCGSIAMITGFGSCKKDEDKQECCTMTYSYSGLTVTTSACEDGTYTSKLNGETVDSGTWNEDYGTWDEAKTVLVEEGATCK